MPVLVTPESLIHVLGVVYVHSKTSDGGDIYLTRFGLQDADLLEIENWQEKSWFDAHKERLQGTSAVYRVPTKEVAGRSLDLVVKNCRVGEHVPVETRTLVEFINAEFNSPWEEFALVMEMREGHYGAPEIHINTQEPLAIYVPPEKMQEWQSGRSQAKINRIVARHPGIDLDILRQYKMIYRWIRGKNAVKVLAELGFCESELAGLLAPLMKKANEDLGKKGYAVADMKPDHIIIGEDHARIIEEMGAGHGPEVKERQVKFLGDLVHIGHYSVIDYELLMRTPAHEEEVSYSRRHHYLDDQRDRFKATDLPSHLKAVEILGVPYICGHAESTGGKLWVVGRNARLFDYFLPERWRKTSSWRLSERGEVYYTVTKDHVHVVWKASKVGEKPPVDPGSARAQEIARGGFNSPFEEFAIALFLNSNGVPTVYARAIYMTGSVKLEPSADLSRFESHRDLVGLDGERILREDRNYITVRGYFNGTDGWVAEQRGRLCRPVNLPKALDWGLIDGAEYRRLFDATLQRMKNVGYDGSALEGNDLILALLPNRTVLKDSEGLPEVRITNFELIRKL